MTTRGKKKGVFVVTTLVTIVVSAVFFAHSAIYTSNYYNLNYNNSTELSWAKSLATYLPEAYRAAQTVIGYDSRMGQMNIYFYNKADGAAGYMYGGLQNIYLNRYYFSDYAKWGSVVAHESAHILFYNYTNANRWNSNMLYYTTFLTESLSWYAGSVVYKYGTKYSEATVKANLQYYANQTGTVQSWYGSGYYYRNNGGLKTTQAIWQLMAIGYYLTGGQTTTSSSQVQKLLYSLRASESSLRNSYTSVKAFENSFKTAYGYYANAGWTYGSYYDTNYLFGKFYYRFYR